MNYPPHIQKLIDLFAKFPGIGNKTATRFVFYLLRKPEVQINDFIAAVADLKKTVRSCEFCRNPFESKTGQKLCPLCSSPMRDKTLLCLVEKEADLMVLEQTGKYRGFYFILGSLLSPMKKKETERLIINALIKRIKQPDGFGLKTDFKEIILALSDTTEGQATALYLERELSPLKLKMSRLGRGLPLGAEIEYADEETLSSALESRKEI